MAKPKAPVKAAPAAKMTPAKQAKKPAGKAAPARKAIAPKKIAKKPIVSLIDEGDIAHAALPPLNPRQQRFVDEYLIDLNGTQAAIRAGYSPSSANEIASENLTKPNIKAAVDIARANQQARTGINADRVLREAARVAFFDPRKLFGDDGAPLGFHSIDADSAAAISGIEVVEVWEGTGKDRVFVGHLKKYRLSDKNPAIDKLMRHLGLYEKDHSQETDPFKAMLLAISGGNSNGLVPVVDDPEARGRVGGAIVPKADIPDDDDD